jgi:hypothetical protein
MKSGDLFVHNQNYDVKCFRFARYGIFPKYFMSSQKKSRSESELLYSFCMITVDTRFNDSSNKCCLPLNSIGRQSSRNQTSFQYYVLHGSTFKIDLLVSVLNTSNMLAHYLVIYLLHAAIGLT